MIRVTMAIPCPHCGYPMDVAEACDGAEEPPKDDDFSICARCLEYLVFCNGVKALRGLTDEEWVELPVETRSELRRERMALMMARNKRRQQR